MNAYWSDYFRRNGLGLGLFILLAVLVWVLVMIILPQLYMMDFSFRANVPPPQWGTETHTYTLEHYKYLIYGNVNSSDTLNYIDLGVFGRTILAAVFVTIIDLCLCYPVAYYLAHVAKRGMGRLMVMTLIVPLRVNELIRALAFKVKNATGVLNNSMLLGIVNLYQPYDFIRANVDL